MEETARIVAFLGLAQIGIAVNLAYLSLEPFRYRSRIRKHTVQKSKILISIDDDMRRQDEFKLIWILGNLEEYGHPPPPPEALKQMPDWFSRPVSRWYSRLYVSGFDQFLLLLFLIGAFVTLSLGTLNESALIAPFAELMRVNARWSIFAFLLLSAVLPFLFVIVGHYIVDKTIDRIDKAIRALQSQHEARHATSPVKRVWRPSP